jgi:hypothetical protein
MVQGNFSQFKKMVVNTMKGGTFFGHQFAPNLHQNRDHQLRKRRSRSSSCRSESSSRDEPAPGARRQCRLTRRRFQCEKSNNSPFHAQHQQEQKHRPKGISRSIGSIRAGGCGDEVKVQRKKRVKTTADQMRRMSMEQSSSRLEWPNQTPDSSPRLWNGAFKHESQFSGGGDALGSLQLTKSAGASSNDTDMNLS